MFKITIIACGTKMPAWVETAVLEYSKRLREYVSLSLLEVPLQKRGKNCDLGRILDKESALIAGLIPQGARLIALDIEGQSFSSEKLAAKFDDLSHTHSHLCFLIGGPEGLSPATRALCEERWSLSALTLPHPLVRILVLEAFYRAWAILNNHPYHK